MKNSIVAVLVLIGAWLLSGLGQRAEAAGYRMPITFGGYTNRTEVLTNFPALVVFSNNVNNSGFNYSNFVTTSGYDLRFVTNLSDTASLDYEIESWDTNGASFVWVRVPTIPTNGSGRIWAKWGDGGNASQLPCTTNGAVWDGDFRAVWHLNNATATTVADSTTNDATGTKKASGQPNEIDGVIGKGQDFDGANSDYVSFASVSQTKLSFSAWCRFDTTDSLYKRVMQLPGCGMYLNHQAHNPARLWFVSLRDTSGFWHTDVGFSPNTLYHVAVTYDSASTANDPLLFVNGVSRTITENIAPSGAQTDNAGTGYLGNRAGFDRPWDGLLDEARLSSVIRSTNWIWAEYQTMASNQTFSTYGNVEAVVAGAPEIAALAASELATTSAQLNGRLNTNGSSSAHVYVLWGPDAMGETLAGWAYTNAFGLNTEPTPRDYSTNTSYTAALTPGATYHYRFYATNDTTNAWSGPQSFTAWQAPAVNNGDGATDITAVSALLRGTVTQGEPMPAVFFCLKQGSDGGTASISDWDRVISAGTASDAFSASAAGLTPGLLYYYRAYATNAVDTAWASAASSFSTLPEQPFNLASNHTVNGGAALVGENPAATLPASAGWLYDFGAYGYTNVNMQGYRIATDNGESFRLDLGGAPLRNGGTLSTIRGALVSGAITVTNAAGAALSNVVTYCTSAVNGPGTGSVRIHGIGSADAANTLTANFIDTGTGPNATAGSVDIHGFYSVTVSGQNSPRRTTYAGAGGIYTLATDEGHPPTAGSVRIGSADAPIGAGGVSIPSGIVTVGRCVNYAFSRAGSISIYTTGPASVGGMNAQSDNTGNNVVVASGGAATLGQISTYSSIGHANSAGSVTVTGNGAGALTIAAIDAVGEGHSGSITLRNYGQVSITGSVTRGTATAGIVNGSLRNPGNVTITNIGTGGVSIPYGWSALKSTTDNNGPASRLLIQTTGPVTLGPLDNRPADAGDTAGNVTISAGGDIVITGAINLDHPTAGSEGSLFATNTVAGATITLASLDLSKVKTAVFHAGGGRSAISGALLNFPTGSPGNGRLDAPTGQVVQYDPGVADNAYLDEERYTLASGGILRPIAPSGTVLLFR